MNCIIIGVAGGTGSGKSTFTRRLEEAFPDDVAVIYHDSYYRRQDEIGTPFCITYDFDSETDGCVTVRLRDSMEQERIAITELDAYFADKFDF